MPGFVSRRQMVSGAVAAATAPALPLHAADPTIHEVEITSFVFDPTVVRVRLGDTIRWINKDLAPHTATADEFGWDTGALARNETGAIVVVDGMETSYFCAFHPHMKGRIEVVGE